MTSPLGNAESRAKTLTELGYTGESVKRVMPDGKEVTEFVFEPWDPNKPYSGKLVFEIAGDKPLIHCDFMMNVKYLAVAKDIARRRCIEKYMQEMSGK